MTELTNDQKDLRNQIIDLLRVHGRLKPSEMQDHTGCQPEDLVIVLNSLTDLSVAKRTSF